MKCLYFSFVVFVCVLTACEQKSLAEKVYDSMIKATERYISDMERARTIEEAQSLEAEYKKRIDYENHRLTNEEIKEYERNIPYEQAEKIKALKNKADEALQQATLRLNRNGSGIFSSSVKSIDPIKQDWYSKGMALYEDLDVETAFIYFQKASEDGNLKAKAKIAEMYYNGDGVDSDLLKAYELYQELAELGVDSVLLKLGEMAYSGKGIKQDFAKAFGFYKKAADKGFSEANKKMGDMFYHEGLNQNLQNALMYYENAASQGNARALHLLGYSYLDGDSRNMVKRDKAKGKKYLEKAADLGVVDAQYKIGFIYSSYYYGDVDYNKAFWYLNKAAEQNHSSAQVRLGQMYYYGLGIKMDAFKAKEYYEKAIAQTQQFPDIIDGNALRELGELYYYGFLGNRNYAKAYDYFIRAVHRNNYDDVAMWYLGEMYRNGYYVEQDYKEAIIWYRVAAKMGNLNAKKQVVEMYQKGIGVKPNYKIANKYSKMSGKYNN